MKHLLMPIPALLLSAGLALADSHGGGGGGGIHFLESWDTDSDGQVTMDEIREKRSDVFYMFDEDENGILDAAEYDEFDALRAADMEANGMKNNKNAPANGLQRQFNDADGDGAVSEQEFQDGAAAWYARLDRNGDGTVNREDFARKGN